MAKILTINDLLDCCKEQIKKGNGNKQILISQDDEGNGFHYLFFGFTDAEEMDCALMPFSADLKKCITLG